MIPASEIDCFAWMVDEAGIVGKIRDGIKKGPRGRKFPENKWRLFFLGQFLSVRYRGSAQMSDIYYTLTREVTVCDQYRLGIREKQADGTERLMIPSDLYNRSRELTKYLEYGVATSPDLSDTERERRHEVVMSINDALCDLFEPAGTTEYAIDATSVWGWILGKGTVSDEKETPGTDAGWAYKTGRGTKPEVFFGFHEHTLVAIGQPGAPVPPVVTRFEMTKPSEDMLAEITLGLIDRCREPVTKVIADRHYQYKDVDRWAKQLAKRNSVQVLDLRDDQHGYTLKDGVLWVAGAPHCPATPESLAVIKKPPLAKKCKECGNTAKDCTCPDAKRLTEEELEPAEKWEEFKTRIAERQAYALHRNAVKDEVSGKSQYMCPARDSKLGCSTIGNDRDAHDLGMIVVNNPPDPNDPDCPKVCTQATVVLTPSDLQRRLTQPDYWGSKAWIADYSRRTAVEGSYGNRKNSQTENLGRGHFKTGGVALANLFSLGAVASYNLRMLQGWHERTGLGDADHPLLLPEDNVFGAVNMTREEYEMFSAWRVA